MRRTRLLAPLAAVATLLSVAAAAQAAPVSLSADDPADGVGGPSRDIAQVRTTFDPDAGRWTVTVRLQAPASSDAWAMVNATLWAPGTSSASCTEGATNFASFRASTNPGSTGAYGSAGAYADGPQPDGSTGPSPYASIAKTTSTDAREVTIEGSSPRLVGRTAACVTLSLSYQNVIQDTLDGGARFPLVPSTTPAPGAGGPQPGAGPRPAPGPGPAPAVAIRLASASRVLRVAGRTIGFRLAAFDRPVTGAAQIRVRGVPVLATGSWSAAAGRPVSVRLRLTAAGRRYLRRHRSPAVRLVVSARPPRAAVVTRTFAARLAAR